MVRDALKLIRADEALEVDVSFFEKLVDEIDKRDVAYYGRVE